MWLLNHEWLQKCIVLCQDFCPFKLTDCFLGKKKKFPRLLSFWHMWQLAQRKPKVSKWWLRKQPACSAWTSVSPTWSSDPTLQIKWGYWSFKKNIWAYFCNSILFRFVEFLFQRPDHLFNSATHVLFMILELIASKQLISFCIYLRVF